MIPRNVSSILLATWAVSGVSLRACTACFGKTDEALAQGMNAGIYAMLVFVGGVGAFWELFRLHRAPVEASERRNRER